MNQAPPHPGAIDFSATILLGRKTATGIRVPDDIVEQLGSGKRPRVHATIYSRRTTMNSRQRRILESFQRAQAFAATLPDALAHASLVPMRTPFRLSVASERPYRIAPPSAKIRTKSPWVHTDGSAPK